MEHLNILNMENKNNYELVCEGCGTSYPHELQSDNGLCPECKRTMVTPIRQQPFHPNIDYAQDMTLRQYFAGLAMQAFISNGDLGENERWHIDLAQDSVYCANALIEELSKTE